MKKTFVLIFLLLLCAQSFSFAEEKRNWNLLSLEGEELEEAELQGLVFNKSTASLKLAKKNDEGSFTFPPMDMEPFEYLVLSWNALTPQEASVELEARFYHEQEQQWSTWFSWGLWQKSPKRLSYSDEDKYGQLSYDTAWVLGDKATANKVQVRGVLKGKDVSLRRIALTTLNTLETEGPVNKEAHPGKVLGELAYSQQIRHPFMA